MSKQCSEGFKQMVRDHLSHISISELGLDTRIHNCLEKMRMESVLELIRWVQDPHRKKIKGIDSPTVEVIRCFLEEYVASVRSQLIRCSAPLNFLDAEAYSVSQFPPDYRQEILNERSSWNGKTERQRRLGQCEQPHFTIPETGSSVVLESDWDKQ